MTQTVYELASDPLVSADVIVSPRGRRYCRPDTAASTRCPSSGALVGIISGSTYRFDPPEAIATDFTDV